MQGSQISQHKRTYSENNHNRDYRDYKDNKEIRDNKENSDNERKLQLQYYKVCEDYKILFDECEKQKRLINKLKGINQDDNISISPDDMSFDRNKNYQIKSLEEKIYLLTTEKKQIKKIVLK